MVLDEGVHVGFGVLAGELEVGFPGEGVVAGAGGHEAVDGLLVDGFAEGVVVFEPAQGAGGVAEVEGSADVIEGVVVGLALGVTRHPGHGRA